MSVATETIVAIKGVKLHRYGSQCETAIYAKSDSRNGYRWYVGFGSDYYPASKAETENFEEYSNPESELADAIENIVGSYVRKYRNGN